MPEQTLTTRGGLLEGLALASAGAVAAGLLVAAAPDPAESGPSRDRDREILNFVLLLEHVQAGFYAEALSKNVLRGELRDFARTVGGQEREHIDAVRGLLGDRAAKAPSLDFGEDTASERAFVVTALKLEDLGVAAYNSQAPNLTVEALTAAATIVSVEARHAAWIRAIAGENPAPRASEPVISPRRVVKILEGSGYVR